MTPTFRELNTVVLTHDLAEAGLRAPATLTAGDMRPVSDEDLLAVRPTSTRPRRCLTRA
jgi:hypothetical protein